MLAVAGVGRGFGAFFAARPRYSRNTAWSVRKEGGDALATLFAATSSASSCTFAPDSAAQIPLLIGRILVLVQTRPHPVNGFAVELAHARFGEPQHFADLAEAALFLAVEPDHELQPFPKL